MPIFEYACKECDQQFEALVYGNENSRMPQVPQQETGAATLGVCSFGKKFGWQRAVSGGLWQLRRPARSGRVFAGRHGLSALPDGSSESVHGSCRLGWGQTLIFSAL